MIDWTKPIQFREQPDCIDLNAIATDIHASNPVLVTYTRFGKKHLWQGQLDGRCDSSKYDIINVPVKHKRKVWIAFQKDGAVHVTNEHKVFVDNTNTVAIAEREIEFTEGEGL